MAIVDAAAVVVVVAAAAAAAAAVVVAVAAGESAERAVGKPRVRGKVLGRHVTLAIVSDLEEKEDIFDS